MRRASSPSGGSETAGFEPGSSGRFVVLEGIDGSGKTEQSHRLVERLERRFAQVEVIETREPTDGVFGRRYRAWARGDGEATPEQVLEFFLEDRREHVSELIRPALSRGAVVVCDRYRASTLAYQAAHGVARETLERMFLTEDLPDPDAELWLRIPVSLALERLGDRASERYERADFLERVDREYARLGLTEVDATGSPDEVTDRLWDRLDPVFARSRS